MNKLFISLCIGFLGFFSLQPGFAEHPIKLVTGNDYAPFTDQALPKGGLATAIISAAFEKSGVQTVMDWKPWKRGYIESKQGRYVGTFPYIPTEERKMDFLYSNPVFTETYVALTNADDQNQYLSYEDMKGKTICRPVGYAIADKIENNLEKWNISLFQPANMAGCIKAIMHLPNHIVVLNRLQAGAELKKPATNVKKIKIHSLNEKGFTLHFIVSKKLENGPHWINRFNKGLASIKKSGQYDRLAEEFGLSKSLIKLD